MTPEQRRRCEHLADYALELIEQGLTQKKNGIDTAEIGALAEKDLEAIYEDIKKQIKAGTIV